MSTCARTMRRSYRTRSTSHSSTSSPRSPPRPCWATAATSSSRATRRSVCSAFLGYLTNFFDPVQQLSQLYSTFLSAVAALDKIMEVLVEEPEVEDEDGSVE